MTTRVPDAPTESARQSLAGRTLSRRRALATFGALGAAGAATALGPLAPVMPSMEASERSARHQWAMVVDMRRCDGCDKCTKACQALHHLEPDQRWINVYPRTSTGGQQYFMPRLCMHCENAPCVRVCPVAATFKNAEGVTLIDQSVCIGCRTCMAACPYEARYFNWAEPQQVASTLAQPMPEFPVPQQRGTVGKCVLCVHNTDVGKLPACVEACTMLALWIGDLVTDTATNGRETVKLSVFLRENDAVRYKEELGTRPRVYYILGHGQDLTV